MDPAMTTRFVASDGDKIAAKINNSNTNTSNGAASQQNGGALLQTLGLCTAVCMYMLLLLIWPRLSLPPFESSSRSENNDLPFPDTLGLSAVVSDENHMVKVERTLFASNNSPIPELADEEESTVQAKTTVYERPERTHSALIAGTDRPPSLPRLSIEDLFISVKTTKKFHRDRLDVITKTWFKLARDQTYFFTDADDEEFSRKTYNHLVNTRCPSSHNRRALCCKMAAEFDRYLQSRKKWWCHFDDDNYVNVPQLLRNLQEFDYRKEWYLGKTSIKDPLELPGQRALWLPPMTAATAGAGTPNKTPQSGSSGPNKKTVSFWFGTGGAGFCISQTLALRMEPLISGGRFSLVGESIRLPDDVTMGFVIEVLLGRQLTVLSNFHSHLESLAYLEQDTFKDQISFSYSQTGNVLSLDNAFDHRLDPTRFLSVHCYLFPQFDICRVLKTETRLEDKEAEGEERQRPRQPRRILTHQQQRHELLL